MRLVTRPYNLNSDHYFLSVRNTPQQHQDFLAFVHGEIGGAEAAYHL